MDFISIQEDNLKEIISNIGYNINSVVLNVSKKQELGEYQYNGVMELAKRNNKNPIELANQIKDKMLETDYYSNVSVAGPGFINITFNEKYVIDYMNKINVDININKPTSKIKL